MLCNSRGRLERLTTLIETLTSTPNHWQKPRVFLCCEGRDLGRGGGRLGLVQLGVKDDIFLLDVLTYAKNLGVLKGILENPTIEKIMWDGRSAVGELFHDHEILVQPAIDLQLVLVYEKAGGQLAARGFLPSESMEKAFRDLSDEVRDSTGVDRSTFARRSSLDEVPNIRPRRSSPKTMQRQGFLDTSAPDGLFTRLFLLQNSPTSYPIHDLP